MISKSDFDNWLHDPVTEAFFEAAKDRTEDSKNILADNAGLDPASDNFYRGFIRAYSEVLDVSFHDVGGVEE